MQNIGHANYTVHLLPLQPEGWFKEPGKQYIPLKECVEARLSGEPFDSFIERKNREAVAKPKTQRNLSKKLLAQDHRERLETMFPGYVLDLR